VTRARVRMDDPRELLRQAFASHGPEWLAAIEAGVDVSLLAENLRLTPTERLEQLQRMTELYEALRPKRGDDDDAADTA
jgi:hypothetical protein